MQIIDLMKTMDNRIHIDEETPSTLNRSTFATNNGTYTSQKRAKNFFINKKQKGHRIE